MAGAGVTARVGERLADDPEQLDAWAAERRGWSPLEHVQLDVTVGCHSVVERDQHLELRAKRPASLFLKAQVVDGAAQLFANALERGNERVGPVGRASAVRQREGMGQVLEGLVVKVAGDSPALHIADLLEPCLRLRSLDRGCEHVGHRLQEVEVAPGEGAARW